MTWPGTVLTEKNTREKGGGGSTHKRTAQALFPLLLPCQERGNRKGEKKQKLFNPLAAKTLDRPAVVDSILLLLGNSQSGNEKHRRNNPSGLFIVYTYRSIGSDRPTWAPKIYHPQPRLERCGSFATDLITE